MRIRKQYQVIPTNALLENGDSTSATNGYTANYINNHSVVVSPTEPSRDARKKVWLQFSDNMCDNNNVLNIALITAQQTIISDTNSKTKYAKVPKNTYISISKTSVTNRFRVGLLNKIPEVGDTFSLAFVSDDSNILTTNIYTGNYEYVVIQYTNQAQEDTTIQVVVNDQTYILNDNNIYEEFNDNKEVILWENSSTTSDFIGQEITLNDDISNYSSYAIIYKYNTSNDRLFSTGQLPINAITILQLAIRFNFIRNINSVSGNKITFGNASFYGTYGSDALSQNNSYLIPVKVIGYK